MTVLVVTGDLHVNSTVALCPPVVELDDGGTYHASKVQRWIWEKWLSFWADVEELRATYGGEVVTLFNGELADDNYHATTQLVSKHTVDQIEASWKALEPARDVTDRFIVTRGSEAHVGTNASIDETLARRLGAETDEGGRAARWHYRGVIDGLRVDAAHHPGTGHARPWTRGGDANRLAQMILADYVEQWIEPPHIAFRGHNHKRSDSGDNHPLRAVILPSWQLTTSFGYRLGSGASPLPIGGMILVLDGGEILVERKRFYRWPMKGWGELS